MSTGPISSLKDQAQASLPLLLFDITSKFTGAVLRLSTHGNSAYPVTFGGNSYTGELKSVAFGGTSVFMETGVDQPEEITLVLGDLAGAYKSWDNVNFFHYADVTVRLVFWDPKLNVTSTDSFVTKYICDAPSRVTPGEMELRLLNKLLLQLVPLPTLRVSRHSPSILPGEGVASSALATAYSNAESDRNDPTWPVPYGPLRGLFGQLGANPYGNFRVGNSDTPQAVNIFSARTIGHSSLGLTVNAQAGHIVFIAAGTGAGQYRRIGSNTATTITLAASEADFSPVPDATSTFVVLFGFLRNTAQQFKDAGLYATDFKNRQTRFFRGIRFTPSQQRVRLVAGPWVDTPVARTARYGDVIPRVYGKGWVPLKLLFIRSSNVLVDFHALACEGQLGGTPIRGVVIEGKLIPRFTNSTNANKTGWYLPANSGRGKTAAQMDSRFPGHDPYNLLQVIYAGVPPEFVGAKPGEKVDEFTGSALVKQGQRLETLDKDGNSLGFAFDNNSVWCFYDLLKLAGWSPAELYGKGFHAASVYAEEPISIFLSPTETKTKKRFRYHAVLDSQRAAAEALRGCRMNARLLVYFTSQGQLAVRSENRLPNTTTTAAIAATGPQFVPVADLAGIHVDDTLVIDTGGSQEEVVVLSVRLNGSAKEFEANFTQTHSSGVGVVGKVAYSFDDSNILLTEEGPAVERSSASMTGVATELTWQFQNEFRQSSQDGGALIQARFANLLRARITRQLPADGIPNADAGVRLSKLQFLKTLRDPDNPSANLLVRLQTTVKGVLIPLGGIVEVTYAPEGWTNKRFRVVGVRPVGEALPFENIEFTLAAHDDAWYDVVNGQLAAADAPDFPDEGTPGGGAEEGGVRPPIFDPTPVSETIVFDNAGLPWVKLSVPVLLPPKLAANTMVAPPSTVDATVTDASTGGSLAADTSYFYKLVALQAGLRVSVSDALEAVTADDGVNTHKLTIDDVVFPPEADQYEVYRSNANDPGVFKRIQAAAAIPSPFTFVDTGLAQAAVLLPESNFIKARVYWREDDDDPDEWHLGKAGKVSPLKFRVPLNLAGKVIVLKLAGVGVGGVESPDSINPTQNYTIVGETGSAIPPVEAILVNNRGFESGDVKWTKETGWSIVNDPANAKKGNWVAKWEGTANAALRNAVHIPVEPGDVIEASLQGKRSVGAASGVKVRISWLNSAEVEILVSPGNIVSGASYARSRVVATAPALAAFARIEAEVDAATTGNTIFADQFRAVLYPRDLDDVPDSAIFRRTSSAYVDASNRPTKLRRTVGAHDVDADTLGETIALDPVNMVLNGGGQKGALGSQAPNWTFGAGNALVPATDDAKFGDRSLKHNNPTAADSFSSQDFSVLASVPYEVSGWIKTTALPAADPGLGAVLNIDAVTGITGFTILEKVGDDFTAIQPDVGILANGVAHDWTFVRARFIPTGADGTIRLYVQLGHGGGQSGTAWFDGIRLTRVWNVDALSDGAIHGRVKNTALTGNEVDLSKAGVVGRVTAAKRVSGVISQDTPTNKVWNNWFQGDSGVLTGQPAAPNVGFFLWANATDQGTAPSFNGQGEINTNPTTSSAGKNGISQDVAFSRMGFPGEDVVIQIQVKNKSATIPNGNFRIRLVALNSGLAEIDTATARVADLAGSNFSQTYDTAVFRTTLPGTGDQANVARYRLQFQNLGSTNEAFRIRRASLSRSVDNPRWDSTHASEKVTDPAAPGGGGGGTGGDPPGGSDCVGEGTALEVLGQGKAELDLIEWSDWVVIEAANGWRLKAVPNHRIYTEHGKRRMDELLIGEMAVTKTGESPVKTVRRLCQPGYKVKIQIPEGHLFWADGFLSHNIKLP